MAKIVILLFLSTIASALDYQQLKGEFCSSVSMDTYKDEKALTLLLSVLKGGSTTPFRGALYTRWGRNSCPNDSQLVYRGYAGGAQWNETGNGGNYVCLPVYPTWGNYDDRPDKYVAGMWGAEYQVGEGDSYNKDLFGTGSSKKLFQYDVPCAVCQSKLRSNVLMVPAKRECFDNWTLEYTGYLMSQRRFAYKSEYVCVDAEPDKYPGRIKNQNGALFYFVEAKCGSLPCAPYGFYVNNRELTCAVCTN